MAESEGAKRTLSTRGLGHRFADYFVDLPYYFEVLRVSKAVYEQGPVDVASLGELAPSQRPIYNNAGVARVNVSQPCRKVFTLLIRKRSCGVDGFEVYAEPFLQLCERILRPINLIISCTQGCGNSKPARGEYPTWRLPSMKRLCRKGYLTPFLRAPARVMCECLALS